MKTKYNVSLENTYLGPINTVPETFFVSILFVLKMCAVKVFGTRKHLFSCWKFAERCDEHNDTKIHVD